MIINAKGGSVPYLSKDVLQYVTEDPQMLGICLTSTDHMVDALCSYEPGIASFVGYPGYTTFVSIKDPCEVFPSGFHVKDSVPIFTRHGKKDLTADSYMNIIEAFKPNIYHALSDDETDINSSRKRIIKSVLRTNVLFETCLERHLKSNRLKNSLFFGPIVGGYDKPSRLQSMKFILKYPEVDGYILQGLHTNGESAMKLNTECLQDIISYCINKLCEDKPKMVCGAFSPLNLLKLIVLGVDIFDTSYVYIVSNSYEGLVFDYDLEAEKQRKKLSIQLKENCFADDFTPILETCACFCCQKYSKAYIHHLIKTKELLAPTLLMIHNMHHYLKFLQNIRKCISEDTVPDLMALLQGCDRSNAKRVNSLPSL